MNKKVLVFTLVVLSAIMSCAFILNAKQTTFGNPLNQRNLELLEQADGGVLGECTDYCVPLNNWRCTITFSNGNVKICYGYYPDPNQSNPTE